MGLNSMPRQTKVTKSKFLQQMADVNMFRSKPHLRVDRHELTTPTSLVHVALLRLCQDDIITHEQHLKIFMEIYEK